MRPSPVPALQECLVSRLFTPFEQRALTLRNRLVVAPMCQYSAVDGMPNDWHLVHLGSRAVGGAGAIIAEASAVSAEGRISPADTGLWNDRQAEAWSRITRFIASQGTVPGIQLGHAGRKASTAPPWLGGIAVSPDDGGWTPVAPSAIAFSETSPVPRALEASELRNVADDFACAAWRAKAAGFQIAEIHAAHGYLLHQFLSPLSNHRTDEYGGSFENRARLLLEVVDAVRKVWPERLPLWLRVSATDWLEGGWDIEESIELARIVKQRGIDLIDVSSGGLAPGAKIPLHAGYQVPFAARIRKEAGIATGAVGLITQPDHAEAIVEQGDADVVLIARELLRDPYFPRRAAKELSGELHGPEQYLRAW
ncbi:NADH:flavin oxidoreductase/NADH oxidase [Lysobacter sp. UC]|uniref:NADH:flavin oxidoreductase/NADH oxidase n=1 Tax=Lysobacter arvi TaxID=3038776 RepID=A0ABU1CD50_9GAMM|nr:NADH:flavin oxidoreductase/NADH oxidase [Lysobacter arvi]MDR0182672.1 NADH:flavin oxidoreductase/NADH oxidase [Lysobacter arvi]